MTLSPLAEKGQLLNTTNMKNKKIYFADYTPFKSHYHLNDGCDVTVSVACRDPEFNHRHHTAFDDCCGGLRLLTEEEVLNIVAKDNAEEGWKHGDVEADGTPILTYAQ